MLVRPVLVDTIFSEEKEMPRSQRVKTHRPVRFEKDLGAAKLFAENEYQDLLNIVALVEDEYDVDNASYKTVRFLLTNSLQVKLCKEGRPSATIRTHLEMGSSEYCATGGNLMFNAENKICVVTNKCSGYLPSFASLQYLVIVLMKNNIMPFADVIEFQNHTKDIRDLKVYKITYLNLLAELSQYDFYRNYNMMKPVSPQSSPKKTTLGKRRFTDSPDSPVPPLTQFKANPTTDGLAIETRTEISAGKTKMLTSSSPIQLGMSASDIMAPPRTLLGITSLPPRSLFGIPSVPAVSTLPSQIRARPAAESLFLHSATPTIFKPVAPAHFDQSLVSKCSSPGPKSA